VVEDPKSKCQEMDQISLIAGSLLGVHTKKNELASPRIEAKGCFIRC